MAKPITAPQTAREAGSGATGTAVTVAWRTAGCPPGTTKLLPAAGVTVKRKPSISTGWGVVTTGVVIEPKALGAAGPVKTALMIEVVSVKVPVPLPLMIWRVMLKFSGVGKVTVPCVPPTLVVIDSRSMFVGALNGPAENPARLMLALVPPLLAVKFGWLGEVV
jgi:hypothetical protein